MSIIYVGMDVHKDSYSLCCFNPSKNQYFGEVTIPADYKRIVKYLHKLNEQNANSLEYRLCYEAGCLGYVLRQKLEDEGFNCVIVAPTTLLKDNRRVKTDRRDARSLAQNLAFGTCSLVRIPNQEDNMVREYLRMRDDHKREFKRIKQEILSFLLRNGYYSDKTPWTIAHLNWIKDLCLPGYLGEVLNAYMETYRTLSERLERMETRIEEIAHEERYKERVGHLCCFKGVRTITAMTIIAEIGDCHRFHSPKNFMSYLGLVPGEHSSGDSTKHLSITKAGNSHVRRILTESAQSIVRGQIGSKSKQLKSRQSGQSEAVINYADRAAIRLQKRYKKLTERGMKHNVTITAVAREFAGFIWGMETGNMERRA